MLASAFQIGGGKTYFTAAELAELKLPGLPGAKRKINERAAAERWALKSDGAGAPLAKPRQGRGGGLEYHLQLLPAAARAELVKRGLAGNGLVSAELPGRAAAPTWGVWETANEKSRQEAMRRAAIVAAIGALEDAGMTRSAAVASVAAEHKLAGSTLWGWLQLVDGVAPSDRLPYLTPRRAGGGAVAAIDAEAWSFLVSDYLRPEQPTFSSCYWRMKREIAEPRGLAIPCERTLRRKLEREVDGRVVIARREGAEALRRTLPAQERSVAGLHALELVNIDGHKFDLFVRFPARAGAPERIGRPIMVAIQDIYSRKILAWRIGETESAVLTRLAFADCFSNWGIPRGCVLDNGRAFASKWITGGAKSRFRFKIREEEPTGVLTALGVAIHWALPYRGQSKPIERGFRDLCDTISRHPAMAGAYTGNRPEAKPENYGARAIDLDAFTAFVGRGIAAHNEKIGRRTETARGVKSFDQVFADSYAAAPIGKARPEQLRLALLAADEVSTDRATGAISLFDNRYWSPEIGLVAGRKVTVRFDPDDLRLPLHVYDRAGQFLGEAPMIAQTGFLDVAAARTRARQEAELKKNVRRQIEIEQLLSAEQLTAMLPAYEDESAPIEPQVIRPVRHRGTTAAALKPRHQAAPEGLSKPTQSPVIDRLAGALERRLRLVQD